MRGFNLQTHGGQHADGHFPIQRLIFDHQDAAVKRRQHPRGLLQCNGSFRQRRAVIGTAGQCSVQLGQTYRLGKLGVQQRVGGGAARTQGNETQQANGAQARSQSAAYFLPEAHRFSNQALIDNQRIVLRTGRGAERLGQRCDLGRTRAPGSQRLSQQHARRSILMHHQYPSAIQAAGRRRHLRRRIGERQRQFERECGAFAGRAAHFEAAAHEFNELARDREAKAGTAEAARGRGVFLGEFIKYSRLAFRCDAHSGISHFNAYIQRSVCCAR